VQVLRIGSAEETGENRYKLPGPGAPEGGPGPDYVAYVFLFLCSIIICRLYKLALSDQAQVTLQLTVSLSDLVCRFVTGALAGGPKIFFLTGARIRSRRP
jgi:hypothetical protein